MPTDYLFDTVMLIDDNRIDMILSKKVIENEHIAAEVLTFTKGREAITYLQEATDQTPMPSAIFLDMLMPDLNGVEFVQAFASLADNVKKDIKIFLVSSSVLSQDQQDTLVSYHPAITYLAKPISKSVVKALR
ncbi:MAG: two-component system response regulator [Thermonemataceae bacterium]